MARSGGTEASYGISFRSGGDRSIAAGVLFLPGNDRRDGTEEEVLKNGMLRAFGMRTVERYKICVLCFAFQRFIATFDSEESTKDMRKILLMPAAFLYKQAVRLRHRLFDWGVLRSEKFDVPVICIGNITVGGTGKTPMAEMVIAYMRQTHNVALLSRGYGRRTKGYLEVGADAHYRDVGDEPLQIKRKFPDAVVVVCERRAEGIRRLTAEHPEVDLIVMDDGFQHRYVEPKINIVMIDATRPVQHDRMLPAGTLRDLPEELHRAHYFVVTKCPENMAPIERRILRKVLIQVAYQKVFFSRFESFRPQPLFPDATAEEGIRHGQEVIAFSGIGNPRPFTDALAENYRVVEELQFDDHHVYRVRDVKAIAGLLERHPGAVAVTTEKDAVKFANRDKIPPEMRGRLYYLPINISFIDDSETDFLQKLEQDVRGN